MYWKELTEEEFDDAVRASDGLCIIPVGCYEMHGEHLPVGTDVYEAETVAAVRAFKVNNALLTERRAHKRPHYN